MQAGVIPVGIPWTWFLIKGLVSVTRRSDFIPQVINWLRGLATYERWPQASLSADILEAWLAGPFTAPFAKKMINIVSLEEL
jgi:hypothetical protein